MEDYRKALALKDKFARQAARKAALSAKTQGRDVSHFDIEDHLQEPPPAANVVINNYYIVVNNNNHYNMNNDKRKTYIDNRNMTLENGSEDDEIIDLTPGRKRLW